MAQRRLRLSNQTGRQTLFDAGVFLQNVNYPFLLDYFCCLCQSMKL